MNRAVRVVIFVAVMLFCWFYSQRGWTQMVTLTGSLQSSNGLPASNFAITFTPTQMGFIAGTGVVVNSTTACATSMDGTVVGQRNPLVRPTVTTGFTGTLAAGNYFIKTAIYDASGTTLASPERVVQLSGTGRLIVAGPSSLPAGATGMRVYIGSSTNAETLQGSTTGAGAFIQSIPLVAGAAVPASNTTLCRQVANDSIWPVGTGYTVALVDTSGNTLPGYPMQWQLMGAGSTINLSGGLPYYNGTVIFPSPILANPPNHATQSIAGGLDLGAYTLTAGAINITGGGANNGVLNAATFPGADIGAKVNAAIAACAGTYDAGCTVLVPAGQYTQTTGIVIGASNVTLSGFGASITGGVQPQMVLVTGSRNAVQGFNLALNGSTYGVVDGGTATRLQFNRFSGDGGIYIAVSGSKRDALVAENEFDGSTGCASHADVSVYLSTHFTVSNNRMTNTCGFGITTAGAHHGVIHGNTLNQAMQQVSVTSTAGQTNYTFNWPSTTPKVQRVWVQVNGHAKSTGVTVVYSSPLVTTVTLPTAPTTGSTVTALGWTALENIQANSQSWDITISDNTIQGGGDTGIDLVSDFHAYPKGSATATQNQQNFTINSGSTFAGDPVVMVGGRIQNPENATVNCVVLVCTVVMATPQVAGTVLTLGDNVVDQGHSVQDDFPGSITITGNTVSENAAAGISPEISARGVVIANNVIENNGLGVDTTAFSSGVFTGGAFPITVKDNTFINSYGIPTMGSAIVVQQVIDDPGTMEKPVKISGNVYQGSFPSGALNVPTLISYRQSGIDIAEGTTLQYPEQPNFDGPWATILPNTRYFTYTYSGIAGMTRDTASVIGGVASGLVASGVHVDVTPSNQLFFLNAMLKVSFWAKKDSGTPFVRVYTSESGFEQPVSVAITDTNWKQYSLYVSVQGMDPTGTFLRLDGDAGAMNVQGIAFAATPFISGDAAVAGTSSAVGNNIAVDSLTLGSGSSNAVQSGASSITAGSCTPSGYIPVIVNGVTLHLATCP